MIKTIRIGDEYRIRGKKKHLFVIRPGDEPHTWRLSVGKEWSKDEACEVITVSSIIIVTTMVLVSRKPVRVTRRLPENASQQSGQAWHRKARNLNLPQRRYPIRLTIVTQPAL